MPTPIEIVRHSALKRLASSSFGYITASEIEVLRRSTSSVDKTSAISDDHLDARNALGVGSWYGPTIRSAFLRWLATDADAAKYLDPLGIRVVDVKIDGDLNLDFCKIKVPLRFRECTFHSSLSLLSAELPALYLTRCALEIISADNLITAHLSLRYSLVNNYVSIVNAHIDGDCDCTGLHVDFDGFSAARAKIGGDLSLRIHSKGSVSLDDMQVGGKLHCLEAGFDKGLSADGITVGRDATIIQVICPGPITFEGAKIGGDLRCELSQISRLDCHLAQVAGTLTLLHQNNPDLQLDLTGAAVSALHDDKSAWPKKGNLHIQEFVYQDLVLYEELPAWLIAEEGATPKAIDQTLDCRIEWLALQPQDEVANPQPWTQLSKLVAHKEGSERGKWVLYKYHRQQVESANALIQLGTLPYHILEEQPLWVAAPILLLEIVGYLVYWRANRMRAMIPTNKDALAAFERSGWLPPGYQPFNPAIYALENVLPVVKLGQDSAWAPNHLAQPGSLLPMWPVILGRFAPLTRYARWLFRLDYQRLAVLRWVLILLGWGLALILAAAISTRFTT